MFQTAIDDIRATFKRPFRPDMDFLSLFLSIGLVIVIIGLWTRILAHLQSRLE